jgi:phospholipase C
MKIHSNLCVTGLLLLACFLFSSCSSNGSEGLGALPKAVNAADEGAAIQALRTISTAQTQAKAMRSSYADFDTLVQLGFLDRRFSGTNPNLRGYRFTVVAKENEFAVNADPQPTETAPTTGSRHFYLDSNDNVVHVNSTQPATRQDPVL